MTVVTTPSDRLIAELAGSHLLAVTVQLLEANGDLIREVNPISGSVTYDATASVRRSMDLTFQEDLIGADPLVPHVATDPLAPYGNLARVARGVTYSDGDAELMSLGVFRIDQVEPHDSGDSLDIHVVGQDRAASVSDAKFEEPYNVAAGTLFTDAILNVVQDGIGVVEYRFVGTAVTTPGLIAEEGDDRWEFAQGLATALGAELFFDRDDVLVMQPIPQAANNPVATIAEGESGVLIEATKRWSRLEQFNRVIVTSENSDVAVPIRGVATDDNPLSPTYYFGPFGKVPRFYSNPYITTSAQAKDAAAGILAAQLGASQAIDFGALVNPTLDVSDVVTFTRERLGLNETHVLDTLTIPLDVEEPMIGESRTVQVLA